MAQANAFYAQSGGVTAVINATACGLIETAREHSDRIGTVFAGSNGIIGALTEELIDTSVEADETIAGLRHTPGGAFGSCRYKLGAIEDNEREYRRLIDVFAAHDIRYFFYNGGGDSQDTANKVTQLGVAARLSHGLHRHSETVDNDLPFTDSCPGFGSVAKYVAVSTREAALDVASMCSTSTKVFILEVMGRHAGWIAAASALAQERRGAPPHLIVFPEVPFDEAALLAKVRKTPWRRAVLLRDRDLGGGAVMPTAFPGGCGRQGCLRTHPARWRGPGARQHCQRRVLATSITGQWRTTCNGLRATSPRPTMRNRRMRWAGPRWNSRWRARMPSCPPWCARAMSLTAGRSARRSCPGWPTSSAGCRRATSARTVSGSPRKRAVISRR